MISSTFPLSVNAQLSWVQARTDRPVGVGFFAFDLPGMTKELELAATSARVVDVFWGDPDPIVVNRIHAGGALAFWQVGSLDEALAAADAGCDVVVAQGVEAGGHVRGTTPLLRLLAQVLPAVDVPVVAAGGIATGAALAAVLNAGAAGARVGTRFVASAESGAHPEYVAALLAASAEEPFVRLPSRRAGQTRPTESWAPPQSTPLVRTTSSGRRSTETSAGRSLAGPASRRRYLLRAT